jgi:D-beta-D-heptose 7-phosphate kinase/D-beta-D-heptose 1-phosphate adenosyltransferase
MREQIPRLLRQFQNRRILVIGDLMVDEFLWGHIERISPEAPVPILKMVRKESTLGGAGNVIKNLTALGARVTALGVVGKDDIGGFILEELDRLRVDRSGVLEDTGRASTRKSRLMSLEHGQQVFRFDSETPHRIETAAEDRLIEIVDSAISRVDAVLCSDYLKGVLTQRVLQDVFSAARQAGRPSVVAPKDSDPAKYCRATVLVPNEKELAQLSRATPNGGDFLAGAAKEAIARLAIESLLVTRGAQGMSLFESVGKRIRRTDVPTEARSVYDVTGAGDTVISVFTLAIASGADHEAATRLANLAAGIVVSKRGTATVTQEEILDALNDDSETRPTPTGVSMLASAAKAETELS